MSEVVELLKEIRATLFLIFGVLVAIGMLLIAIHFSIVGNTFWSKISFYLVIIELIATLIFFFQKLKE